MANERERGFEDQTQLFYQLVTGSARASTNSIACLRAARPIKYVPALWRVLWFTMCSSSTVQRVAPRSSPASGAVIHSMQPSPTWWE